MTRDKTQTPVTEREPVELSKLMAEQPEAIDSDGVPEAVVAWEAEHRRKWPGRRRSDGV